MPDAIPLHQCCTGLDIGGYGKEPTLMADIAERESSMCDDNPLVSIQTGYREVASFMEQKISTIEIREGMYVSSLDRPWLDTPFLMQGFYVTSDDDILALRKYCDYVIIDTSRSANCSEFNVSTPKYPTNARLETFLKGGNPQVTYESTKSVNDEMPDAKIALEKVMSSTLDIMEGFMSGEALNMNELRRSIDPVIESVVRNPDAMMWLLQIKGKSSYTYTRSISNSVMGIAFGRHLGLPKRDLRMLSMGLLLMDVGMSQVPSEVLNKNSKLTTEEFETVKQHVVNGLEMLDETESLSQEIVSILMTHHERFDGSGYPGSLVGVQTPVYGRIAGIIDCYNAMIADRPYTDAISQHKALQQMYNWRNKLFQDELVEQFLQCLGVYPTGSLVELSTGEIGIVLSQNPVRRFRPRIMIVMDASKNPYPEFNEVDLDGQTDNEGEQILTIAQGLEPGQYGIDPSEYYI